MYLKLDTQEVDGWASVIADSAVPWVVTVKLEHQAQTAMELPATDEPRWMILSYKIHRQCFTYV